MRRAGLYSVLGLLVIVVGSLIWSLAAGNSVLLGLDLEGGAEVVLEPDATLDLSGELSAAGLSSAVGGELLYQYEHVFEGFFMKDFCHRSDLLAHRLFRHNRVQDL